MFSSPFKSPFQNPFPTEGAAAAEDWWLSGGISSGDCVAAYQAKGVASLAASYVNLNNPGTDDATLGVAPTWNDTDGWIGDGSAYLKTGLIPIVASWSMVIRYSDMVSLANKTIAGCIGDQGDERFHINPNRNSGVLYGMGQNVQVLPQLLSGVAAISDQKGYRDGTQDGTISSGGNPEVEIYLLGLNNNGSLANNMSGKLQAISIYSTAITAPQVLAVTNAMNLL